MARLAHQLAIESEKVTADVIEISEFPEMARRYNVTSVPKVVLNDRTELLGAQPEKSLVAAVVRIGAKPNGGSSSEAESDSSSSASEADGL